MSSRSFAIVGYGLCLPEGDSKDGDYLIFDALSEKLGVALDTWHFYDDSGLYLALAFTKVDWNETKVPDVTKPEGADDKLSSVLVHLWTEHADLAERYHLPRPEDAVFRWFLRCYHW